MSEKRIINFDTKHIDIQPLNLKPRFYLGWIEMNRLNLSKSTSNRDTSTEMIPLQSVADVNSSGVKAKSSAPVSSKISDLRNFWFHVICSCTEWYSRSGISQVVAAFTEISNSLCCRDVHGLDFEFFDIRYPVASNRTKSKAFLLQTELDWILCFLNKRDFLFAWLIGYLAYTFLLLRPCCEKTCRLPEMSGLWNFSVRVQSWSDKIESDPVLICKIFENHQSHPVLICQCKIMYFYFASWGKRTTGTILPLAKYDWLKAK